jgi:hypothetical protein
VLVVEFVTSAVLAVDAVVDTLDGTVLAVEFVTSAVLAVVEGGDL